MTNPPQEKRCHAQSINLEIFCGTPAASITSIVESPRDDLWRLVTCKRCKAMRKNKTSYTR